MDPMASIKNLRMEPWPIDRLIPYARNPRKNDAQVDRMCAAIKEFGFRIPVVAQSDGTVVDGHLRLKAAQKLGLAEVPVVLADELTDTQIKAFRLLANQSANWAEWDTELLNLELDDLKAADFDVDMIGFDPETLAVEEVGKKGLVDPDEAPEASERTVSRRGDVWLCGEHRVMCGDATTEDDMRILMRDEMADLWLTDPPYNIKYEGRSKKRKAIANDDMGEDAFYDFMLNTYRTSIAVMRPGACFYVWHSDSYGHIFRNAAKAAGLTYRQCLIWVKDLFVLGRQDYQWQHEPCLYGWKGVSATANPYYEEQHEPCLYGWKDGAAHSWESDRKQTTVLHFSKPVTSIEHPTMKPVALFEYLIGNSSKPGDIVLDSFGGSGTAVIAAETSGRRARVMELSESYADVIVRRWQTFAGEQATRESDGVSFNDAEARM